MRNLTILGGGPAGLAIGYYARKQKYPFTIYEAANRVGGNCVTLKHGDFLFDTGAHRLHDKFEDVTNEIKNLLGKNLRKIEAPSQIYHQRKFIDFPLSPLNLLKNLGIFSCLRAGIQLIGGRLMHGAGNDSFEDFAIHTYGRSLANRFLLGYSEKLWGLPCKNLSPRISGSRMKGLGLKTFLIEAMFGKNAKTEHLDGSFYYPRMGYGTIAEELANFCGTQNIRKNAKVTKILHHGGKIESIEINNIERIEVDEVVNTLPLNLLLQMLDPAVPPPVQQIANNLQFRNLILLAVFIDKARITKNASIYFPDSEYPFTRIYEPKNRSECMSPSGKTSLIVEIPCNPGDPFWRMEEAMMMAFIIPHVRKIFGIPEADILDSRMIRIHHAYPILELGFEDKVEQVVHYLSRFDNLQLSGRSGLFAYTHLHDLMKAGKELVEGMPLRAQQMEDESSTRLRPV